MKNFLLALLALSIVALAGCSEKKETTVKPPSTPDAERLKSDSERLQQATANAAREREKAAQASSSPTPTPSQP
jgi:outer membrane murein-binding lipoprotein Lpp